MWHTCKSTKHMHSPESVLVWIMLMTHATVLES